MHFGGLIINKVPTKYHEVCFFCHYFINATRNRLFIGETAGMHITEVKYFHPFKSRGQIIKFQCHPLYLVIVFIAESIYQTSKQGAPGRKTQPA